MPRSQTPSVDSHRLLAGVWSPVCHQTLMDRAVHQRNHWWQWLQKSSCPSSGPQELHALALSSQGPKSDQLIGLSLPPRHHQRQQLGPCKGQLDDRLHLASQGIAGDAATPQIDSARGVHIGLLCGADLHRRLRHLNMNVVVVQAQVSHGLREELQAQAQANYVAGNFTRA